MLFGCDICGLVEDFSQQYMYNDLTVCAKCNNMLHKKKKLIELNETNKKRKGMFDLDD